MPNFIVIPISRLRCGLMVAMGVLMLSCNDSTTATYTLQADMPIRMDVAPTTRAIIEDDDDIKEACNPTLGGESIGIWSSYEIDGVTTNNILGNPNGSVALQYIADTEWDNYGGWTYGENAETWKAKAKYTFNAYFPMDVVNEISTSDVSTFVIDYNTEHYQDDLMTAYTFVDTASVGFNASTPVTLNMLHTLAAVRFQFEFRNSDETTYEDSDHLTACWMENTLAGSGIATTGILAFGTVDSNGTVDGEHIHWYYEDYPQPSITSSPRKIYAWEDAAGVAFGSTTSSATKATAHSTGDGLYSNGWVVIIPQQTDGSVQLCFQLATTGDLVHRINLPATTFEAGKRYTFGIRFGQSGINLTLGIADWNELKSSYNIVL